MNLVRGWNMESTIYYAKCYWEKKMRFLKQMKNLYMNI